MKKCNKCNIEYNNDMNFCKKCGEKLVSFESFQEKKKREEKNKKIINNINIMRYIIGFLLCLISIVNFINGKWQGIIGFAYNIIEMLFGLSLLPLMYIFLFKILKQEKKNFIVKHSMMLEIILPICLVIMGVLLFPGEQLKFIKINDVDKVVAVYENYKINFITNLSEIHFEDYKFFSSDESIATVKDGIIFGKKEGSVTITIEGKYGIKASQTYNVKYVDLESINIEGNTKVLVGENSKLNFSLIPYNSSDKVISWESSNPDIISVDNNGNIFANSKGFAVITITSSKGVKKDIEINSYVKVDFMTFSENLGRVEKGKTLNLSLNINPLDADINSIEWISSNNNVATVEKGVVTAIKEGNVTITAKSINGVTATTQIEVYEVKPESISLSNISETLSVGKTVTVYATINPSNVSDKSIRWTTSNSSVAVVDNGVITTKGRGVAIITATASNGVKSAKMITVTEKAPIKINNFRYTIDSVCGVEWTFSITNNSSKTINYVSLKWYNANAVGDFVYDQITGKNYHSVKYTGPLAPGRNSGSKRNTTKFYNCSYKSSAFSNIIVEYSDGTKTTITTSDMDTYTNLY